MYTYNIDPLKKTKEFDKYNPLFITLRGVFLALILFCASFLSPYIGCNYQYIMKIHPYTRYIMLFLVIYFSINLVDPNSSTLENPIYAVIRSIFVFIVFVLLNNIHVSTIIVMMTFFALLVFTSNYYNYFKQIHLNLSESHTIKLDILHIIQRVLVVCIFILIALSFFTKDKYDKQTSIRLNKCQLK
jgi:hypothetical protein